METHPLDLLEPVDVKMTVADWAVVVAALGQSDFPPNVKSRLNALIFNTVADTPRVLS